MAAIQSPSTEVEMIIQTCDVVDIQTSSIPNSASLTSEVDDSYEGIFTYSLDSQILNESNLLTNVIDFDKICLLCSENISSDQPIWSCLICFHLFHLQCIHNWANSALYSITSKVALSFWKCPFSQCIIRNEDIPTKYFCFCGKIENPPLNFWLSPHSCGKVCGRSLTCFHACNNLCHPGNCPPCAKVVEVKCFCERGGIRVQRCGSTNWSCGGQCKRILECREHYCPQICHESFCPPCPVLVFSKCQCGDHEKYITCRIKKWKCQSICNTILACGNHRCEERCHPLGQSHRCPRTSSRNCPCGKIKFDLSCLEDTPLCGNTCNLKLNCGSHTCEMLCHFGRCSPCKLLVEKICRCRKTRRIGSCGSILICESKCQKFRNCLRHLCKRKCCNGDCYICKVRCNRVLPCGKHRCKIPCHTGCCFPCTYLRTLICACGSSKKQVLCDKNSYSSTRICELYCCKKSCCLHKYIQPHTCHFGECPTCTLMCDKPYIDCVHKCNTRCHSVESIQEKEIVIEEGPWTVIKNIPQRSVQNCPPCNSKVIVSCVGGHIIREQICSERYIFNCDSLCGNTLTCGRHSCQLPCHKVELTKNNISISNCQECDYKCDQKRSKGCSHVCNLTCHSKECPSCLVKVKIPCYCGMLDLEYTCNEWTTSIRSGTLLNSSCKGRCNRIITCGHRCAKTCHPGMCSSSEECRTKITLHCICGTITKKATCKDANSVDCDFVCQKSTVKSNYLPYQKIEWSSHPKKRLKKNTIMNTINPNALKYINRVGSNFKNKIKSRNNLKFNYFRGVLLLSIIIIFFLFMFTNLFIIF